MHNFFIWMKVCCTPANVGGSEKSRPWVCIGGSEKNRLWCVANGMSGIKTLELWVFKVTTFCMDTCMQAFSPLIDCIVHQALLKFTPCRNETLRLYRGLVLDACEKMKTWTTRGSATAEELRDALCQLKYYGRFLTELLTRSSANAQEPCEHTVSRNRVKCHTNVRWIAFENVCKRWMTFKVIQGHRHCYHLIARPYTISY